MPDCVFESIQQLNMMVQTCTGRQLKRNSSSFCDVIYNLPAAAKLQEEGAQ